MAKAPLAIDIRTYQVGFGDCFLLSFVYSKTESRHVLIDFGTTQLPPNRGPRITPAQYMPKVAKDIASSCGHKLAMVVATHRHADHISGFGTDNRTGRSGEVIASCKPDIVLQPWTEDPAAAGNAEAATTASKRSPKGFIQALAAMQDVAFAIHDLARRKPAWMGRSLHNELRFLGMDNIANESAVKNLIAMGARPGARSIWGHYGTKVNLAAALPGVSLRILGPPDLTQSERIRRMRQTDPDEFWHLLGASADAQAGLGAPKRVGVRRGRSHPLPPEGRWFKDRLERLRGEQLLSIVRTLDDQMNNTSLILLFEAAGKKLLFPGDAQIENWSYALQDDRDATKNQQLLADVDLYKVGHHGSLNATPKMLLWPCLHKRGKAKSQRLKALLSTLPGKHGSSQRNTEVPRRTLLQALEHDTVLTNTNDYKWGKEPELSRLVRV